MQTAQVHALKEMLRVHTADRRGHKERDSLVHGELHVRVATRREFEPLFHLPGVL